MYGKYLFLIIAVGFLVYANSLLNGFVGDDKGFVYFAPFVRPLYSLRTIFELPGQAVYRPVHFLYLDLVSVVSQGNPAVIHLMQVVTHIACAVLLYVFFKKFFSDSIALSLGLLFVVHPIQSETVNYIAAGSDILIFLFGILALRQRSYLGMSLLLLSSILSNEGGVSWFFIAAAYLILIKNKNWRQALFLLVPLVLYAYLHTFVSKTSFHNFGSVPIMKLGFWERLPTLPKILFYYLQTSVYPMSLSNSQLWVVRGVTNPDFYIPLLIDMLCIGGVAAAGRYIFLRSRKLFRPYLFFCLWFLFGIAPYLQIVPIDSTVADRWFYTAAAGLLGIIGVVAQTIKLPKHFKLPVIIAVAVIILLLAVRTGVRNADWRSGLTIYGHDVRVNPNFDTHAKFANELLTAGRLDEAESHAGQAVALQPDDIPSLGTLGVTYIRQGKPDRGIPLLIKLLALDPTNYPALTNLTYAYLATDNFTEARAYAQKGLSAYPGDENFRIFLQMAETKYNPITDPVTPDNTLPRMPER